MGAHESHPTCEAGYRQRCITVQVLGLERFDQVAHSYGSSHGLSRIIRWATFSLLGCKLSTNATWW